MCLFVHIICVLFIYVYVFRYSHTVSYSSAQSGLFIFTFDLVHFSGGALHVAICIFSLLLLTTVQYSMVFILCNHILPLTHWHLQIIIQCTFLCISSFGPLRHFL